MSTLFKPTLWSSRIINKGQNRFLWIPYTFSFYTTSKNKSYKKKSLLQTVDILILKWNTVRNSIKNSFLFYQPGCSRVCDVKTALETGETIVLNTAWALLCHSFVVAGKTKLVTHETVTSSFTSVLCFQSSFENLSERCCNTGWMETRCNHQQLLGKKRQ